MIKNCHILLLPLALLATFLWLRESDVPPSMLQSTIAGTPSAISERDADTYRAIFAAQGKADWKQADILLRQVDNPLLLGHVLAERYLNRGYKSQVSELQAWLHRYADHPQAYDIYTLAVAKSPSLKSAVPQVSKPRSLSGYGSDSFSARFTNERDAAAWRRALQAWRSGNKAEASKLFAKLSDTLPQPQSSAAAYWAHRTLSENGDYRRADTYLRRAADGGRNFYSLLARRQLGLPLLETATPALSEGDWLALMRETSTRRTVALAQAGAMELAERELRVLFPRGDEEEKTRLLMLASALKLAPVQMVMAQKLNNDGALDFALYPIPHWQPQDGFKVDPALVYALARQESGFKATAVSPDGAMGLMQLMPQTASMMKKQLSIAARDNASEPSLNMALGQNYVLHLLENGLVDGNLVYMLAAYNAGPARLQEWKKTFAQDDPLLFIESIPFGETRGYVMQVLTNYWIYSELTGASNRSLASLIRGHWPSYDTDTASQFASAHQG